MQLHQYTLHFSLHLHFHEFLFAAKIFQLHGVFSHGSVEFSSSWLVKCERAQLDLDKK